MLRCWRHVLKRYIKNLYVKPKEPNTERLTRYFACDVVCNGIANKSDNTDWRSWLWCRCQDWVGAWQLSQELFPYGCLTTSWNLPRHALLSQREWWKSGYDFFYIFYLSLYLNSVTVPASFLCDVLTVLKRLYEKNKESVDKAAIKRLQDEQSEKEKKALWVQVQLYCGILVYNLKLFVNADFVFVLMLETRRSKTTR